MSLHTVIPPKRVCLESWWVGASPSGFTSECVRRFGEFIDVDLGQQVYQRRADLLATVEAVKQGKQTGAVRRASVR